jgi:hypothetical protein
MHPFLLKAQIQILIPAHLKLPYSSACLIETVLMCLHHAVPLTEKGYQHLHLIAEITEAANPSRQFKLDNSEGSSTICGW